MDIRRQYPTRSLTGAIVAGLNHGLHGAMERKDSEIVILEDTEGAGEKGHMAVGAGNDKKGWIRVSKYALTDKNGEPDGGLSSVGKSDSFIDTYDSRDEMMKANPEYDKVIRLKCTYRTAMKVIQGTIKAAQENYHFLFSNCAQAVGAGLESAKLFSGSSLVPNTRFLELSNYYYSRLKQK